MKTTTVIAQTKKGHRVFLEGIGCTGQRYNVAYVGDDILISFAPEGKRRVVASKGGVIDLESKKVTQWAQGSTQATIVHDRERGLIIIERAVV